MSQASHPSASSTDQLLKLGVTAAQNGNRQAARALFLALAREYPDDVRIWVGLAGVAASRNEQREALERVVALDPGNQRARDALERVAALTDTRTTQALPERMAVARTPVAGEAAAEQAAAEQAAPALAPTPLTQASDDTAPQRATFPLLNLIALGLILLLLVTLGVILGRALLGEQRSATALTATPALILQPAPVGQGATTPAASTLVPPEQPVATAPSAPDAPTAVASAASPTPPLFTTASAQQSGATTVPVPGQSLTLPLGTPIDYDGWTAVLVRPDYALPLDGAIGDLQPTGQFVLTVVSVSNNSPTPRVIPPELFVLVDSAGRSFIPVPGASSAYLALYERGQRGDLALEDGFEPVVGLFSVPIIFDVPRDATGLRLTVRGAGPAGWPVGETVPVSAPAGP